MSKRVYRLAAVGSVICITTGVLLGVGQLLQRIEELTVRVEQLERRQRTVVFQPAGNQPTAVVPTIPREQVPHEQVPKGWSRGEFNGQPYYIVPLVSSKPVTP